MSESTPTGYRDSPDTTDGSVRQDSLVDGVTGENVADAGEKDTELTTDDGAQRDDTVERPGNEPD